VLYRLLADLVLALHLAFIVSVTVGGWLLARHPRLIYVHLPMAAWGALIELMGWICPLTPLEQELRRRGGEAGYAGGFIEHYLTAVIYPNGLTRAIQIGLGVLVLALNVFFYWRWWRAIHRGAEHPAGHSAQARNRSV
jgi:hypothetical protein